MATPLPHPLLRLAEFGFDRVVQKCLKIRDVRAQCVVHFLLVTRMERRSERRAIVFGNLCEDGERERLGGVLIEELEEFIAFLGCLAVEPQCLDDVRRITVPAGDIGVLHKLNSLGKSREHFICAGR